jgi:hypothetical protein
MSDSSSEPTKDAEQKVLARRASQDAERRVLVRHFSQHNQQSAGTLAVKKEDTKKPALAFWKHSVAGATAGIFEVLGTMPLDVAKTNMQMNPGK